MTQMGDNDDMVIALDGDTGNAVTFVGWPEARLRIADCLIGTGTGNPGACMARAEDLLCAMFTGASTTKDS